MGRLKRLTRLDSDQLFLLAFGISVGAHLILLLSELFSLNWFAISKVRRPIEVVYNVEAVQDELRILQEQLARAKREAVSSPAPASLGERTQIRIPDRPALLGEQSLDELLPERGSIIDLTDLVDASRGDPVLLSYFGAIREQIQQTANRQPWLEGEPDGGLVYVSFLLLASGQVQDVTIVSDRSVPSGQLQEVAARIVTAAAPFPAFPPSMASEPSKTIVVPLEFLLGS